MEQQRTDFLKKGDTLKNGKYQILSVLGAGGFGITYKAYDNVLCTEVAVKEYFPRNLISRNRDEGCEIATVAYGRLESFEEGKKRFKKEAKNLAEQHGLRSIVLVREYFEENGTAYIAMEYLRGISLMEKLRQNGRLDYKWLLSRFLPLIQDLEKVHQRNVVHRDISPDNLILVGEEERLVLIDFGAARDYLSDKTVVIFMKKGYAPMEQIGVGSEGPYTDVYALCATFYHCLTGILPQASIARQKEDTVQWPSALGLRVPAYLEAALQKGMALWSADRFQDMGALFRALEAPPTWWQRNRARVLLALGAVGFLSAALLFVNYLKSQKRIIALEITSPAVQTVYAVGQSLNEDGLALRAVQADGAYYQVTDDCRSVYDFSKAGLQPVELLYEGCSATYYVEVLEAEAYQSRIAYDQAQALLDAGELWEAACQFDALGDYEDARQRACDLWDVLTNRRTIAAAGAVNNSDIHNVLYAAVRNDGSVLTSRLSQATREWRDIVAVAAGESHVVGLRRDGTIMAAAAGGLEIGDESFDYSGWTDIVSIAAGIGHSVGLKKDGTVVATGNNDAGQCEVQEWENVVAISAGYVHTFGLCKDGTVLIAGNHTDGLFDFAARASIRALCGGSLLAAGVTADGRIFVTGTSLDADQTAANWISHDWGRDWTDIVTAACGPACVLGVRQDGSVVVAGACEAQVSEWTDIVDVSAGPDYVIGLSRDGNLRYAGVVHSVFSEELWTNIRVPCRELQ